jgi:CRP-like cAMP-binding protein
MAQHRQHHNFNVSNRILLALPQPTWERMRSRLGPINFRQGQVLYHAGARIEHLYFINRGLVSLIKTMEDGRSVEIGAVGIEGIAGLGALYGIESALLEWVGQVSGDAFRVDRSWLGSEMARNGVLRELLGRSHVLAVSQFAQTAACNRLHSIRKRCCRWLLIAHDSAQSDEFELTHEFLALMLGVQRAGVSIAANGLQKAGLIRYGRGRVTIMNRARLEKAACECYRTIRVQLDKLFGPSDTSGTHHQPTAWPPVPLSP